MIMESKRRAVRFGITEWPQLEARLKFSKEAVNEGYDFILLYIALNKLVFRSQLL